MRKTVVLEETPTDICTSTLEAILDHEIISAAKERFLIERAHAGDVESRNSLIEFNILLVAKIASKLAGRGNFRMEDLISAGVCGLIQAIERFDLSLNLRLSTYATWWIRRSITREIDNSLGLIRIPIYAQALVNTVNKAMSKIEADGGDPTIENVAERLEISCKDVERILSYTPYVLSLDKFAEEEGERSLSRGEIVEFDSAPLDNISLEGMLAPLNDIERMILIATLGLYDGNKITVSDTARAMNMSVNKVKGIQSKALSKLKESHIFAPE